jgi:hypothetical protein
MREREREREREKREREREQKKTKRNHLSGIGSLFHPNGWGRNLPKIGL